MLDKLYHFGVLALIAFVGALLTGLIGNEAGVTPIGSIIFAGIWSGSCTSLAYHIGNEEWSVAKTEIILEFVGTIFGAILASFVFIFPGT